MHLWILLERCLCCSTWCRPWMQRPFGLYLGCLQEERYLQVSALHHLTFKRGPGTTSRMPSHHPPRLCSMLLILLSSISLHIHVSSSFLCLQHCFVMGTPFAISLQCDEYDSTGCGSPMFWPTSKCARVQTPTRLCARISNFQGSKRGTDCLLPYPDEFQDKPVRTRW